jgi:predicted nucleic acid-binding protein
METKPITIRVYIVIGDQDLLVLNPFREIEIVTADDFLSQIESV